METKKSTPTKIDFKNEHTGNHGTVYYFTIEFANGDKGQFGTKKREQDKFKVGTETEYTREEKVNGQYTNVTIDKPKQNDGGGQRRNYSDQFKNESVALSYAKDIQVAHIRSGKEYKTDDMLKVADKLLEWLESKKK